MGKVSVFDKPNWFDLSRYDALSELDRSNWANQLGCRYYYFFNADEDRSYEGKKLTREEIKATLKALFENPIIPQPKEGGNRVAMDEKQPAKYAGLFQTYIRPLTCSRLFLLYEELPERYIRTFKEEGWKDKPGELFTRYGNKLVSEISIRRYAEIRSYNPELSAIRILDLSLLATDKQLINDFKQYLKKEREISGFIEGGNIKPGILTKLVRDKVLPYLDLKLWAKYNDIDISNFAMGSWLFPDSDVDPAEKIRRGTKVTADRTLSIDFISTLDEPPGI